MNLNNFRRITSSQAYLPFIDGLRFCAILPVVLVHYIDFYQLHTFPVTKTNFYNHFFITNLAGNSDNAVLLFFAISGFILGLPFAKSIFSKEQFPGLKKFYFRRLTRLEPPYIILLSGLLFINVFIFHKNTLTELLPHYVASFFYLHNIIFKTYPVLNFVFWSLEIEIQFYLLAPLLALVFKLEKTKRRLALIMAILLLGLLNQYYKAPFISIVNYLHYFLGGFLAVDLFLNNTLKKNHRYDLICLALLFLFWTGIVKHGIILSFIFSAFIYLSSVSVMWNKILTLKWISIIGGMCYSIYMLHHPLMAVFLNRFTGNSIMGNNIFFDFSIKLLLTLTVVFIVSSIYFVFVERPFMSKTWYKRFLNLNHKTNA